MLTYSELTSSV